MCLLFNARLSWTLGTFHSLTFWLMITICPMLAASSLPGLPGLPVSCLRAAPAVASCWGAPGIVFWNKLACPLMADAQCTTGELNCLLASWPLAAAFLVSRFLLPSAVIACDVSTQRGAQPASHLGARVRSVPGMRLHRCRGAGGEAWADGGHRRPPGLRCAAASSAARIRSFELNRTLFSLFFF